MEEEEAEGENEPRKTEEEIISERIINTALFAIIWSVGCTIDHKGRKEFSDNLTKIVSEHNLDNNIKYLLLDDFYNY